jgi:hypothetical protein
MALLLADVSEFQEDVDWAAYGAAHRAAIVRAAVTFWSKHRRQTIYRADLKWAQNLPGVRQHCQWRGFYIYMDATANPRRAARLFADTVGPMLPGEIAILDLEEGDGDQTARRAAFLDELHEAVEWTYSGLDFSRHHLPGVKVDWVAAYQGNEPTDAHLLWQNTDAKQWPGIAKVCDGNRFNGTLDDLIALTTIPTILEADMPLNDDDVKKIWGFPGADNAQGGAQTIWRTLVEGTVNSREVHKLEGQVTVLKTALEALAQAKGADVAAITKAVVDKVNSLQL